MPKRSLAALITTAAAAALATAAPAGAASVAYIDGNQLVLSSADGSVKRTLTGDGTSDDPWRNPAQSHDGRTVAVRTVTFEGGARRPVLHLFSPDGRLTSANVMPVYSGATVPVYPIGLDMDWGGQVVAYGYSYCGFACNTLHRGYWLTLSDGQGAFPSNPQGQSDAHFPTFYGRRVVSSDSGGNIFVQPDVAEAPFTSSYQGWLSAPGLDFRRAEVAASGDLVALEWFQESGSASGILVGRHQGVVPSDVSQLCELPVTGASSDVSFSPDGTLMAWKDDAGVKVAGVPDLAAATPACTLSSPVRVISATGTQPSFGGAELGREAPVPGADSPGTPAGGKPGGSPSPVTPVPSGGSGSRAVRVSVTGRASRAAFRRGIRLRVRATGRGRVNAAATVPARVARRLGLARAGRRTSALAATSGARGFASSSSTVVARGQVTARRAGTVTLTLRPTPAARRAARRMTGVRLAVSVSHGGSTGRRTVNLTR